MGWGTGNIGGGSGGLNFKIIAYETEEELLASSPKENTIGVITNTAISNWVFSATEPESPEEGMLWISVGTSSAVEFNALKKNGIQVYPLSAKQYVGGAWVDVTAKSYLGDEWVEWERRFYIFQEGNGVTDGYAIKSFFGSQHGFSVENEKITFSTYKNVGAQIWIDPKVDLTSYSLLCIELTCTDRFAGSYTATVGVGSDLPTGQDSPGAFDASVSSIYNTERELYTVDISAVNIERYIKVAAFAITGYIHNIWLE